MSHIEYWSTKLDIIVVNWAKMWPCQKHKTLSSTENTQERKYKRKWKIKNTKQGIKQSFHVELAPPKEISSLLYTKRVCLPLSAPQLLLLSSITPPAQSSPCPCPKTLQPSQQWESLSLHRTDGESSTKKGRCNCYLSLLAPQLASPPKLWPCHLHPWGRHMVDKGVFSIFPKKKTLLSVKIDQISPPPFL